MNVLPLQVTRQAPQAALKEYNQARAKWDKRDVEIARIYRQIARGNVGDVKRYNLRRLESFIDAIVGKRLTYAALIAKVGV
jgi:hypothetical protein